MRLGILVAIGSLCAFSISCAHKEKPAPKIVEQVEAPVEVKKIEIENGYSCTVGKDKRVITLDKQTKRCEVFYTKFGEKSQVAWAEATPTICSDVFGKIRQNIEGAGFKCTSLLEEPETPRETASSTQ